MAAPAPAPDGWAAAKAPPPTPWAKAGARGWRLCQEAERQARAFRRSGNQRSGNGGGEELLWRRRAHQCPHAIEVLTAAAEDEIVDAAKGLDAFDPPDTFGEHPGVPPPLSTVLDKHRAQAEQALRWLDTAIAEAAARGVRPPAKALYYRAYALTTLGRTELARAAILETIAAGDVQRWRSERMFALIELFAGNVNDALRRAHRGVVGAPKSDRAISRYIRALVLDRAGASAVARAELIALGREAGAPFSRAALESVLSPHERLFFRALDHQANGNRSPAVRLWQAYLAQPEPEEPERVLARRHLAELEPTPAPVDGP